MSYDDDNYTPETRIVEVTKRDHWRGHDFHVSIGNKFSASIWDVTETELRAIRDKINEVLGE